MKRFVGWLFLTKSYLATLSDEEIELRAGITSNRSGYVFERGDRLFARAMKAMRDFNTTLKGNP